MPSNGKSKRRQDEETMKEKSFVMKLLFSQPTPANERLVLMPFNSTQDVFTFLGRVGLTLIRIPIKLMKNKVKHHEISY